MATNIDGRNLWSIAGLAHDPKGVLRKYVNDRIKKTLKAPAEEKSSSRTGWQPTPLLHAGSLASRTAWVMRHLASSPKQVVPSPHPADIFLLLAYGVANPGKFPAQDKVLVAVVVVWRKVVARFMNRYTYIYCRNENKVKTLNRYHPIHLMTHWRERERQRERLPTILPRLSRHPTKQNTMRTYVASRDF